MRIGISEYNRNHTSTYSILEIKKESFEDIKQRLIDIELDWKYVSKDDGYDGSNEEIIIFGTTALKAECE